MQRIPRLGSVLNIFILFTLLYIAFNTFDERRYIRFQPRNNLPSNAKPDKHSGIQSLDSSSNQGNGITGYHGYVEKANDEDDRIVYLITPTYTRMTQPPDMTRLAQTIMAAGGGVHWIVIEDSDHKSPFVTQFLARMPFGCTHLFAPTTKWEKDKHVRGCSQRSAGLQWILDQNITDGVFYFGDDDNAYDIRLFDELRKIEQVGMLPVGNMIITGAMGPVVKNGNITAFFYNWVGARKWPIDMANFGVSIRFWRERGAPKFKVSRRAYLETDFLQAMKVTYDNLEPLAENCTQIYVWHTRTEKVRIDHKAVANKTAKYNDTNISALLKNAFL